jgi:hypothetical protein
MRHRGGAAKRSTTRAPRDLPEGATQRTARADRATYQADLNDTVELEAILGGASDHRGLAENFDKKEA